MSGRETKRLWKESVGDVLPGRGFSAKKKQGFTFSSYHQWLKRTCATRGGAGADSGPGAPTPGSSAHRFVEEILLDYPLAPQSALALFHGSG